MGRGCLGTRLGGTHGWGVGQVPWVMGWLGATPGRVWVSTSKIWATHMTSSNVVADFDKYSKAGIFRLITMWVMRNFANSDRLDLSLQISLFLCVRYYYIISCLKFTVWPVPNSLLD